MATAAPIPRVEVRGTADVVNIPAPAPPPSAPLPGPRDEGALYLRRASLLLVAGEQALDLSEMHFRFQTCQQDEESPTNCSIRVYNLADATVRRIRGEFSKVVLQAGYQSAPFGVVFQGNIKQYRIGADPDGITTYLDILAADGDEAYNFAIVNRTMSAGSTAKDRIDAGIAVMVKHGVQSGQLLIPPTGGVLPRGKVLFGHARSILRQESQTQGATWTIQNGKVNIVPFDGYLPGEAVVLTSMTGLVGRVEQTEGGMRCRCLMNPKLIVGGLVRIDNKSINQTASSKAAEIPGAQLAYNRYAGLQRFATVSADGLYRIYVAEYVGDTRGQEWYTELTCLSVDPVTMKVKQGG